MPRTKRTPTSSPTPYKSKLKETYVSKTERDREEFEALAALGGPEAEPTLPVPQVPEKPEEFTPVELTLGGQMFTIGPISRRGGARAYDEAADFAVEAMPLISRMFSLAVHGQLDVGVETLKTPELAVAEMIQNLEEQDMLGLVRDMRNRLPFLAVIACKGTDPEITEDRVKDLAGSPLNPELLAIVFTQIMADRLLETVLGLGAGFGFR